MLQRAEWQQEQKHKAEAKKKRKTVVNSQGEVVEAEEQQASAQVIDEESLGAILIQQNHLPRTAGEYLDEITTKIDTSEILEIVQVFAH